MLRAGLAAATSLFLLVRGPCARADEAPDWQRRVSISFRIEQDGRYESDQSFDITPYTPRAARDAAEQGFGWSSGLEDVTLVEAATRKPDGSVIPVAEDALVRQAIGADRRYPSFSDWHTRTIIFPDARPGDTLRYRLHRHSVQPLVPGVFEAAMQLGPADHLAAVDLTMTLPAGLAVQVAATGLVEEPPEEPAAGWITRRWHRAADPSGTAAFSASSLPDYAALGAAYAAGAAAASVPDETIRTLAAQLTAGLSTRREQAQALYRYVSAHVRYVGLQLGTGRIQPRPAVEVLRSGHGDCKDHVALLQALLAARGIDAVPALISTRPRYVLSMPPTLGDLDHVILHVPSLDAWLDSTSGYAPFGVLPVGEYGKPVVLADPDDARIAATPALRPGENWVDVRTDLDVTPDGVVSGHTETAAGGPFAVALREIADELGSVSDQLRRLGTPGSGSYAFVPPETPQDNEYRVGVSFLLDDPLLDAATDRIVPPAGATLMVRPGGFLVSDAPVSNGHVCHAGRQSERIRLRLPVGVVAELPAPVSVVAGHAAYRSSWRRDGRDVIVQRDFAVDAPHPLCSEAEYAEMKPALRAARLDRQAPLGLRGLAMAAVTSRTRVTTRPAAARVMPAMAVRSSRRTAPRSAARGVPTS